MPIIVNTGSGLCTLDDVRSLMQKKATDIGQDGLINALIDQASASIMRYCDREFIPGGVFALPTIGERSFEWNRDNNLPARVSLSPFDLRADQSIIVTVDTDQPSPILLDPQYYRFDPIPSPEGVFTALHIAPFGVSISAVRWGQRRVTINGTWGFPAVPADVSLACAMTVTHWITAHPAAARPAMEIQPIVQPRTLPLMVVEMLRPYVRLEVA